MEPPISSSTLRSTRRPQGFLPAVVLIVAVLLEDRPSVAATLTVGLDAAACDYTNLATAIAQAGDGDVLQIQATGFAGTSGINFNITSKSLTLVGGYAGCSGTPSSNPTTLAAQGNDSVVEISGGSGQTVTLFNMVITNGKDDLDDGGGIEIDGDVDVVLGNVDVVLNESERGAGIHLDGSSGATLTLRYFSRVYQNEATLQGGGIYCENGGDIFMEAPSTVDQNLSSGDGGGLWLGDCHLELIADPDVPADSVAISSNQALGHGGGIYAEGDCGVYSQGTPWSLVSIDHNEAGVGAATGNGGGIYATGFSNVMDLDRSRIAYNRADQGGGFYITDSAELGLEMLGSCASSFCSVLQENRATLGAAMVVLGGAFADIESTWIADNQPPAGETGDAPIAYVNTGGSLYLEGCVVESNGVPGGGAVAAVADLGGAVRPSGSTFWGNYGADALFWTLGTFAGEGLILAENDGDLFDVQGGGSWALGCAVVPTAATLPAGGTELHFGSPVLVDPVGSNFHLAPTSPAIDLCSNTTIGLGYDLDRDARPIGAGYDAGADEYPFPLFVDGFELGDTSAWSSTAP